MWVDMGALPNRFSGSPLQDDVPPRNDKVWTRMTRLFVGFPAVFYTGDQYCVFKNNKEDTVVAHSVFSQACEFAFQFRILLGIPGEILLHFVEDSREVFFADLGEVLGY